MKGGLIVSAVEVTVLCVGCVCVFVGAFAISWQLGLIAVGLVAIVSAVDPGGNR